MASARWMADLYVSGLDLSTGRVVQAEEREVWQWHQKGHNGDRTLVCLECYHGAGRPDGKPQMVPLVPRGRIGESAGASARVDAWTADGRRRSDVAVTFPGGARMTIEVQLGAMTDTELLARRDDYARAGTALVWVWHSEKRIPHVLFRFGEPGWVFDPATDRLGLACGRPHHGQPADGTTARSWSAHWPPCPGDDIEVRWMPLAGARLTESGFQPSPEVALLLQAETCTLAACLHCPPGRRSVRTWQCASTRGAVVAPARAPVLVPAMRLPDWSSASVQPGLARDSRP